MHAHTHTHTEREFFFVARFDDKSRSRKRVFRACEFSGASWSVQVIIIINIISSLAAAWLVGSGFFCLYGSRDWLDEGGMSLIISSSEQAKQCLIKCDSKTFSLPRPMIQYVTFFHLLAVCSTSSDGLKDRLWIAEWVFWWCQKLLSFLSSRREVELGRLLLGRRWAPFGRTKVAHRDCPRGASDNMCVRMDCVYTYTYTHTFERVRRYHTWHLDRELDLSHFLSFYLTNQSPNCNRIHSDSRLFGIRIEKHILLQLFFIYPRTRAKEKKIFRFQTQQDTHRWAKQQQQRRRRIFSPIQTIYEISL